MNINLHIERLILDGLPIGKSQAFQVQRAVEDELTRLLTENSLTQHLSAGGAVPSVQASGIQLPADGNPAQIGIYIAQSIYDGVGQKR
jgi:hypothetical protein